MDPLFGLSLHLPERGEGSRLQALQRQLREAIVDGRLRPGLRLPATRALASLAGVSRNTAVAAYELLLAEGYVQARRGAGTFVSTTLIRRPGPAASAEQSLLAKLVPLWRDAPPPEVLPVVRHDFRPGHPDHRLFPYPIWRRLTLRVLRDAERGALAAVDPQGDPALREAIARHASATRAVACDAAGVFVTAGAQQAFELLASVLITPGRAWSRSRTPATSRCAPPSPPAAHGCTTCRSMQRACASMRCRGATTSSRSPLRISRRWA